MKTYTITGAARALLEAHTLPGHRLGGSKRVGPDAWEIEVDDDVAVRLEALDPDPSKAITMACSTGVGHA